MQPILLESSMLSMVGYNPNTQTLTAQFTSGRIYEYYEVPQEIFDALLAADSHGSYFRSEIIGCYADCKVKKWDENS
jgi:KTSC domain